MSTSEPAQTVYRLADLAQTRPTRFNVAPTAKQLDHIATELELIGLRKVRFTGEFTARGKSDWTLSAKLGATVVQPCVATLAPVTTRIDEPVTRHYLASFEEPDSAEAEMPEDDSIEPLPDYVDLLDILVEALSLSIPPYPRVDGTNPQTTVFTEPGKDPLRDEDMRPFAGLAALRDKLGDKDD